jgi:hypothetical protein
MIQSAIGPVQGSSVHFLTLEQGNRAGCCIHASATQDCEMDRIDEHCPERQSDWEQ